MRAGPTNSIVDVPGFRVGDYARADDGWLTGTTVVLPPGEGAVGGVDVRGGGPGTRETDLLDPRNLVERVHAVVLSGGSAYGLDAASGVMAALEADGIGLEVTPGVRVPIVPAAVCFDLGRGGGDRCRPDAEFGRRAYAAASSASPAQGCAGAGTGAKAGGLKGGVGSASVVLPGEGVVAALVVVNAAGSCLDPQTGELYAARFGLPGEFDDLQRPSVADLAASRELAATRPAAYGVGLATTLAVLATDLQLTKAQCQKLAGIGHDGMARAIRPVHTMFDGDTVFALATGGRPSPDSPQLHGLLDAAGDCVTRAIGHAMLAATTTTTPTGTPATTPTGTPTTASDARPVQLRCYQDAFPSARGDNGERD